MERDRDEWRRPWTDDDRPVRTVAAPGTDETVTPQQAAAADEPTPAPGDTPVARPRPLAPPATWGETDAGPGSPSGSVRPPDTVGTVDAPPRSRRRGPATTMLAALFGAVLGTLGTIAVVGPDDGGSVTVAQPDEGGQVQAPTVEVDGEDASNVVPAVAQAVTPSVVRIDIRGEGAGGAEQSLGLGSGVIYRSDGFIITNNHVVEQADGLTVKLADGAEFDAEVVGTDPLNDLAVLKIDETGLPAINLRTDDEPIVGETAIAIGSPFGLDASVTAGVVSATGRDITVPGTNGGNPLLIAAVIQTDAAINPGNSGGALVDREGRLLGINTAILSGSGGSQGVGFAIPAAQAATSADQLIEDGEVQYPLLGVTGVDVTREVADRFGLEEDTGALIENVSPGSGAAEAGLQDDDIIIAVDGQPIESMSDLVVTIRRYQPGDAVEITYLRDGQRRTVEVTLSDRDDFVDRQ